LKYQGHQLRRTIPMIERPPARRSDDEARRLQNRGDFGRNLSVLVRDYDDTFLHPALFVLLIRLRIFVAGAAPLSLKFKFEIEISEPWINLCV
jgi:hypothetical protein